jgi:threonine synthase
MPFAIHCLDCGHEAPYHPLTINCPNCKSQWRQAVYDYQEAAHALKKELPRRPFDLWRYREVLPVHNPNLDLYLGEGGTPLIRAVNMGMMLGCPGIYIKDERQGPTASFKDRQAALTIAALKEAGITELVAASTGNVAISYSAYAARAGIKLWAFVTSLVPAVKMREIALYGSQVVKVTGSYDQVKQIAAEFAQKRGLYHDMGTRTITSVEGMKTIAYEVSEQLTEQLGPPKDTPPGKLRWRTPDWYIQSVSGGLGPVGVAKGYKEMIQMGFTDRLPGIIAVQAEGCAPMVHAWKDDLEEAIPVTNPKTHIETLATGTPGRSYGLLRKQMKEHGGLFESVTDEEAFRAMHVLAKMEGISAEPASAVAFAGLFKLIRAGVIKPTDTVVVNCTGHTMPAEPLVLGSGWARNVVLPQVEKVEAQRDTEEEGLLAALSRVAPDRFPRVAIIDDTADARRLVRRILQSQGDFTIFEASSGREGLELVKREHPDLLILDLMMPEMDGFSVLDALKANPDTAEIPVIVSTAKELTIEEKNRLQGQIQALMQKGDFMSDEFLEEVKALLK